MQSAKCCAPPSRRSSRSTLVITTYVSLSAAMVSREVGAAPPRRAASGRPCATSQNGQRRVQMSPRIMKVAVPLPKHSPMFGQEASSHTVCSFCSRRMRLISWKRESGSRRARGSSPASAAAPRARLDRDARVFARALLLYRRLRACELLAQIVAPSRARPARSEPSRDAEVPRLRHGEARDSRRGRSREKARGPCRR